MEKALYLNILYQQRYFACVVGCVAMVSLAMQFRVLQHYLSPLMQTGRVQLVKLFLIGEIGYSSHNKGIRELTAHHSLV